MLIYLAGGLKGDWQDRAAALLGNHEFLDPRSWQDADPAVYTARDLAAIRHADAVLVYMSADNPSGFGLSIELGYAAALNKRLIFVDDLGRDWRSRYFDMHRQMAQCVRSLGDVAAVLP